MDFRRDASHGCWSTHEMHLRNWPIQSDRATPGKSCSGSGGDIPIQQSEDGIQVHVGGVPGHPRGDHPLDLALLEQGFSDQLDHARLFALDHANLQRAVAVRLDVAAF
jgi:hypothetical protein